MKSKRKLRLQQALCTSFMAFLILLLCGIPVANAQTPQQIAKKALAATVLLVMEDAKGKPLRFGSGFFVATNLIATNFHVIDGAAQGTVKRVGQKKEYIIEKFIKTDKKHDLAILQVLVSGVQPLPLGDSDTVEIGDKVYVVGNPKGYFEGTFSDGIISSVRGDSTNQRLQMTAPISSGSSGGPVLSGSGEVIGVSFATFRGDQNLNFAIPSNYLKELLPRLRTVQPSPRRNQFPSSELGNNKGDFANYDNPIRLNPNDAEAYFNRGKVKSKSGQYFAALADYDSVIRLKPDHADAYLNRGMIKEKLGQYNDALKDFASAIRIKPNYAEAYYNRGKVKIMLSDTRSARRYFQAALKFAKQIGDEHFKSQIESTIRELD